MKSIEGKSGLSISFSFVEHFMATMIAKINSNKIRSSFRKWMKYWIKSLWANKTEKKNKTKKSYNLLFNIHHHQKAFQTPSLSSTVLIETFQNRKGSLSQIWIGICSFTLMLYIFLMHLKEWKCARTIRFGYGIRKLKCLLSFAFFLLHCIISILILLLLIITRKPTHVKFCYVRSFFFFFFLLLLL